jgi:hypothetical protein
MQHSYKLYNIILKSIVAEPGTGHHLEQDLHNSQKIRIICFSQSCNTCKNLNAWALYECQYCINNMYICNFLQEEYCIIE